MEKSKRSWEDRYREKRKAKGEGETIDIDGDESHQIKKKKKIKVAVIHTLRPKDPGDAMINYLTEMGIRLKETEDLLDKSILVQNINKEIIGHHVALSAIPECSFIIQDLLENSGVYEIHEYLIHSIDFTVYLFNHHCASHVIETVFSLILRYLKTGDTTNRKYSDDEKITNSTINKSEIISLVKSVVSKLSSNISLIAYDSCGSHSLRSLLFLLNGRIYNKKDPYKNSSDNFIKETFIDQWALIIDELLQCADIDKAIQNTNTSLVYQTCIALGSLSDKSKIINLLMKGPIDRWTRAKYTSHIVEFILQYCTDEHFEQIFNNVYKGNLLSYSLHFHANHCVQKLLLNLRTVKQCSRCIHELRKSLQELFPIRVAVIIALIKCCLKYKVKEEKLFNTITEIITPNIEEIADISREDNGEYTYGVSLLLLLCQFNNSVSLSMRTTLLNEYAELLIDISVSRFGSLAMDDLFSNNSTNTYGFIEKIIKLLTKSLLKVALNKYGSFVVEKAFSISNTTFKELFAKKLLAIEKQLLGNVYGKILYNKLQISLFRENKKRWIDLQTANKPTKRESSFDPINKSLKRPTNRHDGDDNKDGVDNMECEEREGKILEFMKKNEFI